MRTLGQMRRRVLALIEELDKGAEGMTNDVDIRAKFNDAADLVQFELARLKKIPEYVEIDVEKGDVLRLKDIGDECGRSIFQLGNISGVQHELRAAGTVLRVLQTGTMKIDCFVYPQHIAEDTEDDHELELSDDALGIMPWGIAAALLKNDVSSDYGAAYRSQYEGMLQRLDSRVVMPGIYVEGGVDI